MQVNRRSAPNILITGTPGVGKSTLCEKLAVSTGLKWLEISKIAKENGCIEEFDEEYKCGVLDEDKGDQAAKTVGCRLNLADTTRFFYVSNTTVWVIRNPPKALGSLLDGLEDVMSSGGNIVDYHSCDFFPERWFDIVFVLRTNNTILFDRLTARGYDGKKLKDNVDCEIFQTILEEARSAYNESIVHEIVNSSFEELESNLQRIYMWLQQWFEDNKLK